MSALKPCPFCGSDEIEMQESHVGFSVECFNCDFHVGGDLTMSAAESKWNTRVGVQMPRELTVAQAKAVSQRRPATVREMYKMIVEVVGNE